MDKSIFVLHGFDEDKNNRRKAHSGTTNARRGIKAILSGKDKASLPMDNFGQIISETYKSKKKKLSKKG